MKYSKEERLEIGRRIYVGELSTTLAAKDYNINYYTAREYLRAYKAEINGRFRKKSGLKESKKKARTVRCHAGQPMRTCPKKN